MRKKNSDPKNFDETKTSMYNGGKLVLGLSKTGN